MSKLTESKEGLRALLMGNEAIARGALEAGVNVAAGYPGTPSSEIIENLSRAAKDRDLYVEWSANEKIALEVAAAASFAGLRALCAMKQNGVNVASDFLLHLAGSGTRGALVLVSCDDPGALSSVNEGESRHFARMVEIPLLEPGDFQEAKDMTKWAFDLSDEIKNIVMVRSVTRMSHASGNVWFGGLPEKSAKAAFKFDGPFLDPETGPVISSPCPTAITCSTRNSRRSGKSSRQARSIPIRAPQTGAAPHYQQRLQPVQPRGHPPSGPRGSGGAAETGHHLAPAPEAAEEIPLANRPGPDRGGGHSLPGRELKILAAEQAREIGVKTFYGKNEGYYPHDRRAQPGPGRYGSLPDLGNPLCAHGGGIRKKG